MNTVINILEVVAMVVLAFSVIGVHELAHLITGLVQGFKFEMFVVGFLGIKREDKRIKVYLNTNLQYFGGVAGTFPRDNDPTNSTKFAHVLLAGPIASIVLSIILAILYYSFDSQYSDYLLTGALTSFAIFLATTVPNKTGMFFTDRKRYQRLTSPGKDREVELALLNIIGNYGRSDSYKSVDLANIETVITDSDFGYMGRYFKLGYQFEKDGHFDSDTMKEFEEQSKEMPKSQNHM